MSANAQFDVVNDRKLAQLYTACCTGNSATIEFALKKKFPINSTVKFSATEFLGDTALHLVVKASRRPVQEPDQIEMFCKIVKRLLFLGADVTKTNAATYSPIHVACRTQVNPLIISALFTGHPYNNVTDRHGLSHFHIACMNNESSLVENFLIEGVAINSICHEVYNTTLDYNTILGKRGFTALHLAVRNNSFDTVKLLMKYRADVNIKNQEDLNPLRSLNNPDFKSDTISEELLWGNYREDTDDLELFKLFHACRNEEYCYYERALKLNPNTIRSPVSNNSRQWPGFTLLHFAAAFKLTSVEQFFWPYITHDDIIAKTTDKLNPLHCLLKSYTHEDEDNRAGRILKFAKFLIHYAGNWMTVDTEDSYGFTPIHYALRRARDLKAAQFIRRFLEIIGLSGFYADEELNKLCYACLEDDYEYVEKLSKNNQLKNFVNVTCSAVLPSLQGFTLLHFAILARNERIVNILMENGAEFCIQSAIGLSPLHLAERLESTRAITEWSRKLFLTQLVNPVDQDGLSHLHIACRHNAVDVVRSFIENKIDLNCTITKDIRLEGCDDCIYRQGDTLLHTSARKGCLDIVALLLKSGVDCTLQNADGKTPIHLIFDSCKLVTPNDIISSMLKKIINVVDNDGLSYFHIACSMGLRDIVKELLQQEPNAAFEGNNWDTETPLHVAVNSKCLQLVQILVDHGANVSAMNKCGKTPLHYALLMRSDHEHKTEIINCLLSKLDVEQTKVIDHTGLTLLHIAAMQNDTETVKRLIGLGVDVNTAMNLNSPIWPGFTPLRLAVGFRCPDVVTLLLDEGADFTVKSQNGISSFDLMSKQVASCFIPVNDDWRNICDAVFRSKRLPEIIDKPFIHHRSIFHSICQTGEVDVLIEILELKFDINHPVDYFSEEYSGYTGLHFAVDSGSLDSVETLVNHGADLNAEDAFGMTPVHRACIESNMEILNILISNGAFINGRAIQYKPRHQSMSHFAKDGLHNLVTPIHICAIKEKFDMLLFLVNNGADMLSANAAGKGACWLGTKDLSARQMVMRYIQTLAFFKSSIPEDSSDRLDPMHECKKLLNDTTDVGGGTTLSDLITATPKKMYLLTKRIKLQHILRSHEYNDKYPKRGFILKLQYQKGLAYRALVQETFYSIHRFVECYLPLPELCIWKILENLDENDLKNLMQTSNRFLFNRP